MWRQLWIGFCHMSKCVLKLQWNLEWYSDTERTFEKADCELLWVSFYNQ